MTSVDVFERFEGMLTTLPQQLVISEYFNFDRFNEVVLALPLPGLDRLFTPTSVVEPGPDAIALAADYATRRITIDDGRSTQNPDPAIHPGNGDVFDLTNRFRGGDTITGITGVVDDTSGSTGSTPPRTARTPWPTRGRRHRARSAAGSPSPP